MSSQNGIMVTKRDLEILADMLASAIDGMS